MSNREWPRTFARLLGLFGVIFLVSLSSSSEWFVIHSEAKFVEGPPREPTIIINYTINSTEEEINLEIKNATPLRTYFRNRELPIKHYTAEELESFNTEEEKDDNFLDLEKSREIMLYLFVTMMIIQIFSLLIPSMKLYFPLFVWFLGLIGFVLIVPLGAVSSFGFEGPTGGFSDETEEDEFVHMTNETDLELNLEGVKFTLSTLGFDLGYIPINEHDYVRENPPKEGEENFDSLMGVEAFIMLNFSDAIKYWLYVPLIWIFLTIIDKIFLIKVDEEE